jgi:uncharacterized protein
MTSAVPSEATRAPRPIPVRRLAFDFDRVRSRHWFGGNPFLTHLAHALSLTFPEGERFFMEAVRHYEKRITSPALRQEITRFLAQEGLHARAHADFNAWIRGLGFDTEPLERGVKEGLARARRLRSPIEQLAMTCALEHFTAIMAELLLDNDELRERMDPEARRLWVWHAIEETEHKAVAFDTYLAVGGTYRMRVISMAVTTVFFIVTASMHQVRLMRQDPEAKGAAFRGLFELWGRPGYFRPLVPAYLDYFRPGFHPWQREPRRGFDVLRREMASAIVKGAA